MGHFCGFALSNLYGDGLPKNQRRSLILLLSPYPSASVLRNWNRVVSAICFSVGAVDHVSGSRPLLYYYDKGQMTF